jgi:hypothetical protein
MASTHLLRRPSTVALTTSQWAAGSEGQKTRIDGGCRQFELIADRPVLATGNLGINHLV